MVVPTVRAYGRHDIDGLQATDATTAWRLLSEPWVFVVDKEGIVRASFETIVSPDELKAAIAAVR